MKDYNCFNYVDNDRQDLVCHFLKSLNVSFKKTQVDSNEWEFSVKEKNGEKLERVIKIVKKYY